MANNNIRTALIVDLEGNLTERAERYSRSMSQLARSGTRGFAKLGEGARVASDGIDSWGNRTLVVSGAVAYGFNRTFVRTAADFERYQIMLNKLQGSSEGGKAAMDWIQKFTEETPYNVEGVTQSFLKLKAFGLDPMNGTLEAIADQTALMGGGQVEMDGIALALGQAWTKGKLQGEEALQLLERGVPVWDYLVSASKELGQNKGLGYTAQQLQEMASKGQLTRKAIQALIDQMGRASKGAAQDQMNSWNGMLSNMGDHWTFFQKDVMDSGAFSVLKEQLGGLLSQLDQMKETGEYDALVQTVGTNLVDAFKGVGDAVQDIQAFGEGVVDVYTRVADLMDEVATFTGLKADPATGPNALDQVQQGVGTREMTAAVIEFVAGVYVLNKTARLLAPLLKGGAAAGGWMLGRNKGDIPSPNTPASGRGLSGIKLPLPVYMVNDRMSLMPDEMGGQPDLPQKEQTPKKKKAGRVARGGEKALTGVRSAGRTIANSPKAAGAAAVVIDGLMLMPTLLSDDVSREDKVQATAETAGGAAGAWAGAAAGAALFSFVPIVGTALGGMLGGIVGYVGGQWAGEQVAEQINQSLDLTVKLEGAPGTKAEVVGMKSSSDNLNSQVYYGAGMR